MKHQSLESIIENEYGVGVVTCDPIVILWAVEKITDKQVARKELKKVNALRSKYGKPVAYAPWGSHAY